MYGICFCPVSRKDQLKDLKVAGRLSRHVRPVHVTCTSGSFSSHAPQASAVHVHIRLVLLTCTSGQCTSRAHQACAPHMHLRPVHITCTSGPCSPHVRQAPSLHMHVRPVLFRCIYPTTAQCFSQQEAACPRERSLCV